LPPSRRNPKQIVLTGTTSPTATTRNDFKGNLDG